MSTPIHEKKKPFFPQPVMLSVIQTFENFFIFTILKPCVLGYEIENQYTSYHPKQIIRIK